MPPSSDKETGLETKVHIESNTSEQESGNKPETAVSSNLPIKIGLVIVIVSLLAGATVLFIKSQEGSAETVPGYSPLTKKTDGDGNSGTPDVGVYASGAETSVCKEIDGTPSSMPISPVLTNYCKRRRSDCSMLLDTATCSNKGCRFGYRTNALGCPVSCDCLTNGVIEGTIKMDTNNMALLYPYQPLKDLNYYDLVQRDGRVANIFQRWSSSEIPFMFEANSFNDSVKIEIKKHLAVFSHRSCVKFVETSDIFVQHVFIKKGAICSSPVGGMSTELRTEVMMSDECANLEGVLHIFMQVLGFHHTQNLPIRDEYIKVIQGNVEKDYLPYFDKLGFALDLNVEYNLHSIMHTPLRAFSADEKMSTMEVLTAKAVKHAAQTGLQNTDITAINIRYQCPEYREVIEKLEASWSTWGEWKSHPAIDACARVRLCVRQSTKRLSVGCSNPKNPNWVLDYQQSIDCEAKNLTVGGRHHGGDHTRHHGPEHKTEGEKKTSLFKSADSMTLFCPGGRIYPAKFNGDNTGDIYCHFKNGFGRIYIAEGASYPQILWEGETHICAQGGGRLIVMDIDGDSFSDIGCIYPTGQIDVSLYDDGMFHDAVSFSEVFEMCSKDLGNQATIRDADGDGKSDLLCGTENGFQHIYYNVFTKELNTTVDYQLL